MAIPHNLLLFSDLLIMFIKEKRCLFFCSRHPLKHRAPLLFQCMTRAECGSLESPIKKMHILFNSRSKPRDRALSFNSQLNLGITNINHKSSSSLDELDIILFFKDKHSLRGTHRVFAHDLVLLTWLHGLHLI